MGRVVGAQCVRVAPGDESPSLVWHRLEWFGTGLAQAGGHGAVSYYLTQWQGLINHSAPSGMVLG